MVLKNSLHHHQTRLRFPYVDSLLIGGELTEDMIGVSWADADLREGQEFLGHLFQQCPHLQQRCPGLI